MGSFVFSLLLCDLFLSLKNNYFTNYTDETTPYVIGSNPVANWNIIGSKPFWDIMH